MRVFITSVPDELKPCRAAAVDIVRELGHEPLLRDPAGRRGLDLVASCVRVDVMLALVGWRRGPVPAVAQGGDDLRPWTLWEVRNAFAHGVPVMALMAGRAFAHEFREAEPEARAMMSDFRGELARLAVVFDNEESFRRLARVQLSKLERASQTSDPVVGPRLRRFPEPEFPAQPYPLLLPYTHPDLMAGREEDFAQLRRLLTRPLTVVGLHAASGTGKSSLLAGALVPKLRAEGWSVAFVRHPTEAGIAAHLLGDLTEDGGDEKIDPRSFVESLVAVHRQADRPPLLVIDQFEAVLKEGEEQARGALGTLLAASAQRVPGFEGSACRWLLAYRQEYHGRLVEWLEDVLREVRDLGAEQIDTLPHDLSSSSRFAAWPLRPLATPTEGDPVDAAARVFLDVIEKPLGLQRWPWKFAPGHAERLAHAFAEARVARPNAPLVPELQVVLAHRFEQAGEPVGDEPVIIKVPHEPGELIDRALEEHLRRSLDSAYADAVGDSARKARSRALLVLRELADIHGRRKEGCASETLARALGDDGHELLERLSTPRTRLVLLERQGGAQVYVLAHDRLAEVLIRVVDEGHWAGFGVDAELLGLRRFVALQSRLFASGDVEQAIAVPKGYFEKIESARDVFLWSEVHRSWWEACRTRQRNRWRRLATRWSWVAVVVVAVAYGAWTTADRWVRRQSLLEEVASGEPEVAFAALDLLTSENRYEQEPLLDLLLTREKPFDIFERGLGGVGEERRAEALVRVAELAMPIVKASPEDPVLIASLIWALDFFARDPGLKARASRLRDEALAPLRLRYPPPPMPKPSDPNWANVPAGTFWMGAGPSEKRDKPYMQDELPRHQVTLSAFRIMSHEVTNAEYRRLVADHEGVESWPATQITWYQAYVYAAWLGGRLPTESEWEYVARANCSYAYCRQDGTEARLDEVAWWIGNSADSETGETSPKPVMQLESNPWGVWDIYGNVGEWNANWYAPYTTASEKDPPGPMGSPFDSRVVRGGSVWQPRAQTFASEREKLTPNSITSLAGLRVMILESPGMLD